MNNSTGKMVIFVAQQFKRIFEEFEIKEGDAFRIDPNGARCIKADNASPLRFVCVQAKANTLEGFTQTDGLPVDTKPSWL